MAKDARVRLGIRLKEWRLTRRLTQERLAERAGLSYKFIGEIERGRGNPTVETLSRLSHALDVDVVDLFGPVDAWKPLEVPGLTPRDLQTVREVARSLGNVVEHLEGVTYRRRRRRIRS